MGGACGKTLWSRRRIERRSDLGDAEDGEEQRKRARGREQAEYAASSGAGHPVSSIVQTSGNIDASGIPIEEGPVHQSPRSLLAESVVQAPLNSDPSISDADQRPRIDGVDVQTPTDHQIADVSLTPGAEPLIPHSKSDIQDSLVKPEELEKELIHVKGKLQAAVSSRDAALAKLSQSERQRAEESLDSGSYTASHATPVMLRAAIQEVNKRLRLYCRTLHRELKDHLGMKDSKKLLHGLQRPDVVLHRETHIKYVLEATVSAALFQDFENESFQRNGTVHALDNSTRCSQKFAAYQDVRMLLDSRESWTRSGSGNQAEYVERVRSALMSSLTLHCVPKLQLGENGASCPDIMMSESDQSLQLFRSLAMSVWALHELAFAFQPPAHIFRISAGAAMDPAFMKPVDCFADLSAAQCKRGLKVQFMTFPGFRVRNTVLACEVYPSQAPGLSES